MAARRPASPPASVEAEFVEAEFVEPSRLYRGSTSRAIGVMIAEATAKIVGDPFYGAQLKSINESLGDHDLLPVLLTAQSTTDLRRVEAYFMGGHLAGAILGSLRVDNPLPNRLRAAGIPTVLWGCPARGTVASYVDVDNRHGAHLAVEHLISLGHRKIATISGNLDMAHAFDRRAGYQDALLAAGIPLDPTLEEVANYLPERAHMAMERLLLNHPDVDSVFVASDLMAAAAVRVLRQARKRIPEDIAIVGFDDSPTAIATDPPLTSIHQPIEEVGRETVEMLMREIDDPRGEPRQLVLTTSLVIRESTIGVESPGVAA
jgi:DNA-binding LacI/PurR family transcriptional regulator